jgi:hypothetical protein
MKNLKVKVILEVLGKPEEHINKTLNLLKEKLEKDEQTFKLESTKIFDAQSVKEPEGFFSGFVEADLVFKNLDKLTGFCFDYMPSSVEIIDPESVHMKNSDVNILLNDLLARMHQYDMAMKNMYAENMILKKELKEKDVKKE